MRLWSALVVLLAPAPLLACPACALHQPAGPGMFALVAAMIAVPYAVTVVAAKVIRRLASDEDRQ
jgi:hypothetical protein